MKIIIDAGHGGRDPGAVGAKGLKESWVNLKIAKRVKKLLSKNYKVKLTRWRNNYISLQDRCKRANKLKGDLFISIHCNSSGREARGVETYVAVKPSRKTFDLAESIQRELSKVATPDRGIKFNNFAVLVGTEMPAVLVECDFISNPAVEKLMRTSKWRKAVAKAIAKGIRKFARSL